MTANKISKTFLGDKLHSFDNIPAIQEINKDRKIVLQEWYTNGLLDRDPEIGPASINIVYNTDGFTKFNEFFRNNQLVHASRKLYEDGRDFEISSEEEKFTPEGKPLEQTWYFKDGSKCIIELGKGIRTICFYDKHGMIHTDCGFAYIQDKYTENSVLKNKCYTHGDLKQSITYFPDGKTKTITIHHDAFSKTTTRFNEDGEVIGKFSYTKKDNGLDWVLNSPTKDIERKYKNIVAILKKALEENN